MSDEHFNQTPKRQAEFITVPNTLKAKVGSGGLSDAILDKAQILLESHSQDFAPLAEMYLRHLEVGIGIAKNTGPRGDQEQALSCMIYPTMQLKANGGMCGYPFVTDIADMLIHFLEVVAAPDADCIEIVEAFYTTIRLITQAKITAGDTDQAKDLKKALHEACQRYFDHYPDRINLLGFES